MKKLIILGLFAFPLAFAGQSIQLSTQTVSASVPAFGTSANSRTQFALQDWNAAATTGAIGSGPDGLQIAIINSSGVLSMQIYRNTASGGSYAVCLFRLPVSPFVYVNYEADQTGALGTAKTDYCQAWDITGSLFNNTQASFTTQASNSSGVVLSSNNPAQNLSWAFFRIYSTLVSTTATLPTTAQSLTGCVVSWKFDLGNNTGSPNDSCSAGPYNASVSGSQVYVNTTTSAQNRIGGSICFEICANLPVWLTSLPGNNWTWDISGRRADHVPFVDASQLWSQSDATPIPTSFSMSNTTGPTTLTFGTATANTSTVGNVASTIHVQDYTISIVVSDGVVTPTLTGHVGGVSLNANCQVDQPDPLIDAFYGTPGQKAMIGWGCNPWGYQDWWHKHASDLRLSDYVAPGPFVVGYPNPWIQGASNKPQWEYQGSGTISWPVNCNGNTSVVACGENVFTGSIAVASVSVGDATFTLSNTTGLDLSTFPTHLVITDGAAHAEVRIDSHTGSLMTVSYDGWGQSTAHTFAIGAQVFQSKVQGTGTHFLTDAAAAVCPVGAPGPPGPSAYSTGTVNLTAGSNVATASGGAVWTQDKLVGSVSWFRVSATHSGTPFIFSAQNLTGYATAIPTVSGGQITAIAPGGGFFNGQNYISGGVSVVITDSVGTGASFTANVVGGAITSYTQVSGGTGYVNPTVTINATKAMLSRVFPATADTATGLSYNIMLGQRTLVTFAPHPLTTAGVSELLWGNSDCESETEMYYSPYGAYSTFNNQGHDIGGYGTAGRVSAMPYAVTDSNSWVNGSTTGGISFYSESLAHCALHYRSGLTDPLTACNEMSDYWMLSPWGNADGNGFDRLFLGGEGIGGFAARVLRGRGPSWGDLRGYGQMGWQMVADRVATGCNITDTRDTGYAFTWLILSAMYDPGTGTNDAPGGLTWHNYWKAQVAAMKTVDDACQSQSSTGDALNSFANGALWNAYSPSITLINGSAVATYAAQGTGPDTSIIPALCSGTASGTATVINGSETLTIVTGTAPTGSDLTSIFITGTNSSGANVQVNNIDYSGSGTTGSPLTLGQKWTGDSGTVTWISQNMANTGPQGGGSYMMTIAMNNDDVADLSKNWACIRNSSTQLTLNRAWDGISSDPTHIYHPYVYGLAGFGQQPFMLGIKTYGTNTLAHNTVSDLAAYIAPYTIFAKNSAEWLWNFGMDHELYTTNYGRVFQLAEPTALIAPGTLFQWKVPNATYGGNLNQLASAREQNTETSNSHGIYYLNNNNPTNKALGDNFYGAVWGYCPWTTGGKYCDQWSTAGNVNAGQLTDDSIHQGKWFGFFAGMGFSSQWPSIEQTPASSISSVLILGNATIRGTATVHDDNQN